MKLEGLVMVGLVYTGLPSTFQTATVFSPPANVMLAEKLIEAYWQMVCGADDKVVASTMPRTGAAA